MEREGGFLQSTISLRKRPEKSQPSRCSGLAQRIPPSIPAIEDKQNIGLPSQANISPPQGSLSFLSSIRFQTGSDFPSFHTFRTVRSILPHRNPAHFLFTTRFHHAKIFIFSLSYSPDRNIRPLVPLGHHPTKHPLRNTLSIEQMPPNLNFPCAVQPAFCPHKTHSVMPTQPRQQ